MAGPRLVVVAPLAGAVCLAAGHGQLTTVPQRDDRRCTIDAPTVAVSGSGSHVAFVSYAQLVPADTSAAPDVYVFDRASGRVTLESGGAAGVDAFGSLHPGISDDGRFVVYQTAMTTRASPGSAVVLRDREKDVTTVLATGPPSGWDGAPVISADGRIVAFVSAATNLVPGTDANGSAVDVYIVDVATRELERVSVDANGRQPAVGASFAPAISADGRRVAFASSAVLDRQQTTGLPFLERPRLPQVYLRDRVDRTTRLVSAAPDGRAADGQAWKPSIDAAGRHVAFVSTSITLTADDRARGADVFVADLATGAVAVVSRSARGGPGNAPSASPALSADGRFVAFQSEASDLLCAATCPAAQEDINLLPDVFLFDRQARTMTRASGTASAGWLEASVGPALDRSGAIVAFSSRHPIGAADTKNDFDLFILSRNAQGAVEQLGAPLRRRDGSNGRPRARALALADAVRAWGPGGHERAALSRCRSANCR